MDRTAPETIVAAAGASPGPGDHFGRRYEIVRLLGRGGTGAVYLARDHELARDVALKVIAPHLAADGAALERFRREVQLSTVVTHPNVLRVYDLGEADGLEFLTMQAIDGQPLDQLVRRERPLPVDRATVLFRQVCAGVAAAHQKGVAHRDLKPQDVLVDVAGTAYVTGLGQLDGKLSDPRADVLALGQILRELIGEVPAVPPALRGVLDRCLATDPEARYGDAAEVVSALDAAALPARPRRARWPALAGAAALALAAAVWWAARPTRAPAGHDSVSVVVADLDNRSGDAAFDDTVEPILKIALEEAHLAAFDRDHLRRTVAVPPPERLDERAAREIAVRQGLGVVVTCSITLESGKYQLSLKALDAMTGGVIAAVKDGASSKTRVLELAPKLAADLGLAIRHANSERRAASAPGPRDGGTTR